MALGATVCYFITTAGKITVVVMLIANALDLLPKSVTFTEFHITEPMPLTGKLALNTLLNNAERLFENDIKGPEGLAIVNGELYTSLHGGYVAKVTHNKIIPIVRFGKPCKHWWDEERCGRPLGMATTENGYLIVADAYYGIFKLNPRTGAFVNLVERDVEIAGAMPRIFNDVTVAKDGSIYWTHSSSDFNLCDGILTMLADPSGRLMRYDPVKKKSEVLLDGLYFANGVALSEKEDFVVVCETGRSRITRYYLKGPKKSQSDIFIDGLPGLPDGIRRSGKGGFIVSLNVARDEQNPILSDYFATLPILRRTVARLFAFTEWTIVQVYNMFPNNFSRRLSYIIGHFEMLSLLFPKRATVLEVLENGEINASFHALDGSVRGISDVIVYKGYLYMGSPYNTYLARTSLSKLEGKFEDTGKRLK